MVRDIVRDISFLSTVSEECCVEDLFLKDDLKDTLLFHRGHCLGLAANMIGFNKRAIAFLDGEDVTVMFNPVIVSAEGPYETDEGCLSLEDIRKTVRYRSVEIEYLNHRMRPSIRSYSGLVAEVIQHEIDHLEGRII